MRKIEVVIVSSSSSSSATATAVNKQHGPDNQTEQGDVTTTVRPRDPVCAVAITVLIVHDCCCCPYVAAARTTGARANCSRSAATVGPRTQSKRGKHKKHMLTFHAF